MTDYEYQESNEDSVDASKQRPDDYREKHEELITAIKNDTDNTVAKRMIITIKQKWVEKQLYRRFKWQINVNPHEKTWTWLRIETLKEKHNPPQIAAQNNAMKTNHIKARIDKTQQNSKCKLFGDRDETINHIISECSKLAPKDYKTRNECVGKVIQ